MSKHKQVFFLFLILSFSLSACNLQLVENTQDPEAANLELTAIVQQMLIDQAAQQGNIVEITATPGAGNASPTEEVVIPAEVLPPSVGDVTVTVSVATNCRVGPGTAFKSIYGMPVGQVAKVVAKNSYSGYWIIEIPGQNGQTCWLWGQYATINGDTAGLKDVVTPTSVATLKPTATATATSTTSAGAPAVAGCTNSAASNYNSAATVDDGSCVFTAQATILGCTDQGAANYNRNATADDGSCIYDVIVTNTSVSCEDQLDGNYKFTYTINWIKNNTVSGLEYYIKYRWEEGDETPRSENETVPVSTSPTIVTAIKPRNLRLSFWFIVVNPLTTVRTTTNPIRIKCP